MIVQGLADTVPGARHISIPNAAHICNIQNPDAFDETLRGFLRDRPAWGLCDPTSRGQAVGWW